MHRANTAHRVGKPAPEILQLIPEPDVRESCARCCSAGTYGYKKEKHLIANGRGQRTVRFRGCAGPGCNDDCFRHRNLPLANRIGHRLPSRHPIEIVAAAYGLYNLESRQLTN